MRLTDAKGRAYEVAGHLGRGGQGTVYAIRGGKLAAKLLFTRSPLQRDQLRSKLEWLRTLPLDSIAIAKPLELLAAPNVGYLMQFCSGMLSAHNLLAPPRGTASVLRWYIETGGLRRRLVLLTRLAAALNRLHGMGLAFADLSDRNVFVSEDLTEQEVQLIDADNLVYESSPECAIYTPGFGAPELVRGEAGNSTLTDAHSFSVIAFQMLSLVHPLLGDLVRDGEPELEQEAYSGRLPWVDHPIDDRNRASDGIPRDIVLSPKLKALCDRCFGAGLAHPGERPRISEWLEALDSARNFTVKCEGCSSTYYVRSPRCPFCDSSAPRFFRVALRMRPRQRNRSFLHLRPDEASTFQSLREQTQTVFIGP
jgi:DNA-binding helix-hairpin-helix protein with protein kinase domain